MFHQALTSFSAARSLKGNYPMVVVGRTLDAARHLVSENLNRRSWVERGSIRLVLIRYSQDKFPSASEAVVCYLGVAIEPCSGSYHTVIRTLMKDSDRGR